MLFNSLSFALFFPLVFILYWYGFNKSLKAQNIFLFIASYVFYGFWDWRFLFLLAFSTFLDYFTGFKIYNAASKNSKKIWLFISIFVNLGFLGVFKYFNFFADSFAALLQLAGLQTNISSLNLILPVGISFYTFHGLSYVLDIYYERITPTKNWIDYTLFVSFFPLLVAGPIERATHLLPQVQKPRVFIHAKAVDGLRQILWGLFKKIVIADSCAQIANTIFNDSGSYSGSTLAIGALMFTFQIYADFSGYTDIALGIARLLGFELLQNFKFPYFSRNIAEFWRRWHISLSSWFKDYLYIPLGGSKGSVLKKIRNTFIIFVVSGFWHGANWTFIVWGALNALYIMPSIFFYTNRNNIDIVARGKTFPSPCDFINILLTFLMTVFAWIFFRANDLHHAFDYIATIFSPSLFAVPELLPRQQIVLVLVFLLIEWLGREGNYALENLGLGWKRRCRLVFYNAIFLAILFLYGREQQFIYFQF